MSNEQNNITYDEALKIYKDKFLTEIIDNDPHGFREGFKDWLKQEGLEVKDDPHLVK